MKQNILIAIGLLLILSGSVNAQISPVPVAETEMRDNTIKRRAMELERFKRESNKLRPGESTKEREIRFAEIKEDFEKIQKSQDSIVKVYTTEKKINYAKISKLANSINKNAFRLDQNLFGEKPENNPENKKTKKERKSVRDLIIALDNSIGKFIESPLFQSKNTVDSEVSETAQSELKNILKLSNMLSVEAEKMK